MMTSLDQVEAQALALSDDERAELAERLVESLSTSKNRAAWVSWLELAKKRRQEIQNGSVVGIPGEEGSAMVRKLVGR